MLYQLSYLAPAPSVSAPPLAFACEPEARGVIGAGLDLGQQRRGVDMGPSAIRYAELQERIAALGRECEDWGDVEEAVAEATEIGDPQARYLGAIMRSCGRIAAPRREGAWPRATCRSCSAATTRSRSGRSAGWRRRTAPAASSGSMRTAT